MRKTGMTMLAAIPFASGFAIDAFMHGLVDRLKRQGLRQEIAGALLAGLPLLIAVRRDFLPAWSDFAGDDWQELPVDEEVVERWVQAATAVAAVAA